MISTIVVDDQPLILDNICTKIRACDDEFDIVAKCTNGIEAIKLIERYHPQVVFTDIKMPLIDGLQLIESVSSETPSPLFVIVSGYDDFSYAKRAITAGVFDYLLKPLKTKDLKELLERIKEKISKTQEEVGRNILYSALLLGKIPTENISSLPYQNYAITLICFGHCLERCVETSYNVDPSQYIEKLDESLHDVISVQDKSWFYRSQPYNELIILTAFQEQMAITATQFSQHLLSTLEFLPFPITVITSDLIPDLSELHTKYQQLRRNLSEQIIFSKSSALPQPSNAKHWFGIPFSIEKNLISFLQHSQKEQFLHTVHQLLDSYENRNCPQIHLQQCILQIAYLCQNHGVSQPDYDSDITSYIINTVADSKDYSCLKTNLDIFFKYYFDHPNFERISNNVEIVQNTRDYLKEHLGEPISLNDISQFLNLHPTYLSKVFKNSVGQTPIQYLASLRIESAKELLKKPENRIKDVAEFCGYSDQFYFSKVFKEATGESPSKYKSRFSEKNDLSE